MSQNAQTHHSEFENCPILELCPSEYNQFPFSEPRRAGNFGRRKKNRIILCPICRFLAAQPWSLAAGLPVGRRVSWCGVVLVVRGRAALCCVRLKCG